MLAPQWDEMPKQTHVYSAWHPSLCVIQSQTWGTPYPYMLSTKCFVGSCWFHIPSHDVQTCPNNSKFKSDSALLQDTVNHGDLLGHHSKPVTRRCQGLIGSRKWPLHVHMPTVLPTLSCLKFGSTIVASCYGPPIEAKCL